MAIKENPMSTRFYGVWNIIEITDEKYEIGDLLAEDCFGVNGNKVKALAYLGASIVLNANNKSSYVKIPAFIPENLRDAIDDCIIENYGLGEK